MTREEAVKCLMKEQESTVNSCREQFLEQLTNRKEELCCWLKEQMLEVYKEQQRLKKKSCFLYFSLMRVDLWNHKFQVTIQGQDSQWYLDENPIWITSSMDSFFQPLEKLWGVLQIASRKFVQKINSYELFAMVSEIAMEWNQILGEHLRPIFRQLEEEGEIPLFQEAKILMIRWGEYRDRSEIMLQIDRNEKTEEVWEADIKAGKKKEDFFVFYYSEDSILTGGNLQGQLCYYASFFRCTLTGISFIQSNLVMGRMKECRICGCSFQGADLRGMDFRGSYLEQVDFTEANVEGAIFSVETLPYLHLSADQLQLILVEEEGEHAVL